MKQRASHIFPKAKQGWYIEPAWCSERLFQREEFGDVVWDPACGWGTITTAAKAAGYGVMASDIVNRRRHRVNNFVKYDFLNGKSIQSPRNFSVVTNPPFDHVEEFAKRAYDLGAQKIAMIMLVRRLNAAHWMRELPLEKILLLTPRPSMPPGEWIRAGNTPGGGTQDFCWVVIKRGHWGAAKLGWLPRDETD